MRRFIYLFALVAITSSLACTSTRKKTQGNSQDYYGGSNIGIQGYPPSTRESFTRKAFGG